MSEKIFSVLLVLVIIAEVVLLALYHHEHFREYMDAVITFLFFLAAYFFFQYLRISGKLPTRVMKLLPISNYDFMVEKLRKEEIAKLLKTKQIQ